MTIPDEVDEFICVARTFSDEHFQNSLIAEIRRLTHEVSALSVVKESLTADGFDVHAFIATVNAPDLEKFARLLFAESEWPEGGDIDGFAFQEAAIECGLLTAETRTQACAENCHCAETQGFEGPVICFRKAAFLMEPK